MLNFLLFIADEQYHPEIIKLYEMFHDDLIRRARNTLRNNGCLDYMNTSEDAVQICFVKVVKYAPSVNFDLPEATLKAYMYTILSNVIFDIMRDSVFVADIDDCEEACVDDDNFIERLHIKENYDLVVKAIGKLDERYSITLLMRYSAELTVKEIANELGIPEKSVYTRLNRGKVMLLKMLESGGVVYE